MKKIIKILLVISILMNIGLVVYSFYMQTIAEKATIEVEKQRIIAKTNMEKVMECQVLAEQAHKQAEMATRRAEAALADAQEQRLRAESKIK